jgi:hypothetical protein
MLFATAVTSGSQLLAPLSAARSKNTPSAGRPHALAETVLLGAVPLLRLKSRFAHLFVWSSLGELSGRSQGRPIWLKIEAKL